MLGLLESMRHNVTECIPAPLLIVGTIYITIVISVVLYNAITKIT